MEDNSPQQKDLEKLLRDQLKKVEASPDDNTWAQIAARQSGRNIWLRARRVLLFAGPVAVLLLVAGIAFYRVQYTQQPEDSLPIPNQQTPLPNTNEPLASTGSTDVFSENQAVTNENGLKKSVNALRTGQRFGARVNSVPAATIHFQAQSGLRYQSPISGSSVNIPANSLVNSAGEPVSGDVELMFREYRGIEDFLASGIPMHYGDGRGTFFFNSGGMFEVRISQGGEALQMAPGQTYDLSFSPTDRLTSPSLYFFDETKNAWVYRPDAAFAGQNGPVPTLVSETEVVRNNTDGQSPQCLPELRNEPAMYMQSGVKMGLELASGRIAMPTWFRKNPRLTDEQLLNGQEKGLIRVVRDRDRVEQLFPEDLDNAFTELKAFKDCYFIRRVDSLASSQLTEKLATQKYWERIYILQDHGSTCRITLYSKDDKVEFYADLVGSAVAKSFDYDKVLAEYGRLRKGRQQTTVDLAAKLRNFLFIAPVFQTAEEWCMTPPDWLEYFDKNHPKMQRRYQDLVESGFTTNDSLAKAVLMTWNNRLKDLYSEQFEKNTANMTKKSVKSLTYTLKLNSFGVYNCDQIFMLGRGEEPTYVYANYQTPDGKSLYPASVSVLDRSARLFFTLPNPERLLYQPGRNFDVIVTGYDGRCYRLTGEKYAEAKLLTRGETNKIVVQDVTDQTQSPKDWATLLAI